MVEILAILCHKQHLAVSERLEEAFSLSFYSVYNNRTSPVERFSVPEPCFCLAPALKLDLVMAVLPSSTLFYSLVGGVKEAVRWAPVLNQRLGVFSHANSHVALATETGAVSVWSYPERVVVIQQTPHSGAITGLDFSPEGDLLVTSSSDCHCKVLSLSGDTVKSLVFSEHEGTEDLPFHAAKFSKSGDVLYTVAGYSLVYITQWEVENEYRPISTHLIHRAPMKSFCLSYDGFYIGIGTADGWLKIISTRTMEFELDSEESSSEIRAVCYTWDSRYLALATKNEYKLVANTRGEGLFSKFSKFLLLFMLLAWIYLKFFKD